MKVRFLYSSCWNLQGMADWKNGGSLSKASYWHRGYLIVLKAHEMCYL